MKTLRPAVWLLFTVVLLTAVLLPDKIRGYSAWLAGFLAAVQLLYLLYVLAGKNALKKRTVGDALLLLFGLLFFWELLTAKLNLINGFLYPPPGQVIYLFYANLPELLKGLWHSLLLLGVGFIAALVAGMGLALMIGLHSRSYLLAKVLTRLLGPIPPIVYIPYAIVILPTFRSASIFIIFIGSFWPIFISTLNGVFAIDRTLIDSAKAINVRRRDMLLHVILPGCIPAIISGATVGLAFAFILLTSAEMIGATSGMGWYVKYFSDFANYPKVIVGIIFIGLVVCAITFFTDKLERYLLRWRK